MPGRSRKAYSACFRRKTKCLRAAYGVFQFCARQEIACLERETGQKTGRTTVPANTDMILIPRNLNPTQDPNTVVPSPGMIDLTMTYFEAPTFIAPIVQDQISQFGQFEDTASSFYPGPTVSTLIPSNGSLIEDSGPVPSFHSSSWSIHTGEYPNHQ